MINGYPDGAITMNMRQFESVGISSPSGTGDLMKSFCPRVDSNLGLVPLIARQQADYRSMII